MKSLKNKTRIDQSMNNNFQNKDSGLKQIYEDAKNKPSSSKHIDEALNNFLNDEIGGG